MYKNHTIFKTETTCCIPTILLLKDEEIHPLLEKNRYRSGFPGISYRSWKRLHDVGIHTIHDLIEKYKSSEPTWFQETTKSSDSDYSDFYWIMSTRYY
jgi:nucleotidyltransferase/DNA polymerase involved in DNA repair